MANWLYAPLLRSRNGSLWLRLAHKEMRWSEFNCQKRSKSLTSSPGELANDWIEHSRYGDHMFTPAGTLLIKHVPRDFKYFMKAISFSGYLVVQPPRLRPIEVRCSHDVGSALRPCG